MSRLTAVIIGTFCWAGDRVGDISNRTYRIAEKMDYLSGWI